MAAIVCRTLAVDEPPKRLDATDGMAVALCHYYMTSNPLYQALADNRAKGLGGTKKGARGGSKSWAQFLAAHPDREIK